MYETLSASILLEDPSLVKYYCWHLLKELEATKHEAYLEVALSGTLEGVVFVAAFNLREAVDVGS